MTNATRITTAAMGAFVGLAGIEHGIGEILQGSVRPDGLMFPSWPGSEFFSILGGEPAMSVIPDLLVTGILAVSISLAAIGWAVFFVQRRHGGLVLMLLSALMLPLGGGIFPPVLGVLIGAIGTRIHAPLAWGRAPGWLGKLWPWALTACIAVWLAMVPGISLLYVGFGIDNPNLILVLLPGMFGFLGLTCAAAFAHDRQVPVMAQHATPVL